MNKPTVVITGGGQGLGRATALSFAKNGFDVVLVGRTLSKLQAVASEIEQYGRQAQVFAMDVTNSEAVAALSGAVSHVDCLIHCAGESLIKSAEASTVEDWERIFAVNLKAPFFVSKALLPQLRRSANPTILMIGSKTSMAGFPDVSVYTASKTGLVGLTRALAADLRADNIRVVMVAPGPMDTPMRWSATPDYDRNLLIMPETVADTLYTLASLPRGVVTSEFLLQSIHFEA